MSGRGEKFVMTSLDEVRFGDPPVPPPQAPFAWDESKHPRGQPENAGEFGPGGGGPSASPVPPTALARYHHSLLGYVADNGPAPAGELAGHLGDRHRLGAAKARAVVEHLASTGDLVRAEDEYGRGVLAPPGKPASHAPAPAPAPRPAPVPAAASPAAHAVRHFESLLARPEYARTGLVPIHALRAAAGLPRQALDDALMALDRADVLRLVSVGDRSRMTTEQLVGGIGGENETFVYVEKGPEWDSGRAAFSWQDQPRVPAGSPEGGEWGSGGGGAAAEKPPPAKPRVDVGLTDREEAAIAKIIKGPLKIRGGLTGEQLAALGGAADDGQVTVRPGKDNKSLVIHVGDGFTAVRVLRRLGSGELIMKNQRIEVTEKGKGLGTEVFGRQVDACRALGVGSIRCHAARRSPTGGPQFNGYYTWPRLGYDQSFEDIEGQGDGEVVRLALKRFPGTTSVLGLMATPEGRAWWKDHGPDLHEARFDLADGSPSMTVFTAYREERARG